jgi:hypothetical protein
VLSDRGSELIQCRAVVVQAAVRHLGSLSDGVDPNEDHADILRRLRRLGSACLNGGHGVPARGRLHQTERRRLIDLGVHGAMTLSMAEFGRAISSVLRHVCDHAHLDSLPPLRLAALDLPDARWVTP